MRVLISSLTLLLALSATQAYADTASTNEGAANTGQAVQQALQEKRLQEKQSQQTQALTQLKSDVRLFVGDDLTLQQQRLNAFRQDRQQQSVLLARAQERLRAADREQERLKSRFDNNETSLSELETLLRQRTGQLGEVFGVVKEQSGELQHQLHASLVSAEFPGREQSLSFAGNKAVPTLSELETLWYQLHHEMQQSGRISRFPAAVAGADGRISDQQVLRVGGFNAVTASGAFLDWQPERQQLSELAGQPETSEQQAAQAFFAGEGDELLVDVSGGSLLALIGQRPGLVDQIRQGGSVGYIILALGVMGLLTAAYKLVRLYQLRHRMNRQLKSEQASPDNPLGRVLIACQQVLKGAPHQDAESLNTRLSNTLDEALLRELPALESGQSMLKLLAAAAPLLGLLGTVTGMIGTFQSITLFGTSDPKLMAGGISQALITTVFGLVVAIPMLFSHGLLSSQSRALLMILQEKSLAQLNLTPPSPPLPDSTDGATTSQSIRSAKDAEESPEHALA